MFTRSISIVVVLLIVCLNAAFAQTPAAITSPSQGATISGTSQVFDWSPGSEVTAYWLDVGSTQYGQQYTTGDMFTSLTKTVNGLPLNGSTVYATLYSLIDDQWQSNSYYYYMLNGPSDAATMTSVSPCNSPCTTLESGTVTFTWTAGTGATQYTQYWLDVGSTLGGQQYTTGNLGTLQSKTVNGLPLNGSMVYVTLYTLVGGVGGQWFSNVYTYTMLNPTGTLAAMLTPGPGTTLTGQVVTFTWSADPNATAYWLDIGSTPNGQQYLTGNLETATSVVVDPLPTDGSEVYVTLYSEVGGQWFSNAYTYTAATGFTLVQHVNNPSCVSSTTCLIVLDKSIAAGDLLIFESSMSGASIMTKTDNGIGTFVQCVSCVGFDASSLYSETSGGWILSASAQSTAITVTFSVAAGGAVEMWEYSYTNTTGGTLGFDGANQNESYSSSSPTAAAFTPTSGRYDISVQACHANAACNSVSAPFTGDNTDNENAWAYLENVLNWTSPTWTLAGSTTSQLTQMEFGYGVDPCANTMFMDFGGTSGSAISLAQLASGTHGWQGGAWSINGTPADLTFQTSASQPLQNPTGRLCDGGNYTDSSTTGLQYSTADNETYLQINATGGILTGTSVSAGAWYYSTLPATDLSRTDDLVIFGAGDFVNMHEFGDGTERNAEIECGGGTSATSVILARSTWYWVDILYNETGHTMKIYNNANPPVLQGSMTCPSVGTVPPGYITIGNANSDAITSGYIFDYDGLKISLDGKDPLLP